MKNMPDAEDVVQDTFVKLMQKNPTFESEEHEKAWLIRVTINLCKNLLKTTWFKKTVPLDHTVEFTQQESIVIDAVLELSVKYRSVILLYYIIGYNIKEISDILGRKEATIASQLQRARAQLKSKLKEDFDYE
jgi:RNA polymerase sigma-70 factor (ECF subfamily)